MARDGYLILDSDLHMMEPDDLWASYLEGPHRANLPRFFGGQQQRLADGAFPEAMQQFFSLPFSAEVRRKILWENCARLYNISKSGA